MTELDIFRYPVGRYRYHIEYKPIDGELYDVIEELCIPLQVGAGAEPSILASAGNDTTVQCTALASPGTPVRLDGTRSIGDGLTYAWSADGVTFDAANSATPTGRFPLGRTTVSLRVEACSESSPASVDVIVVDDRPPVLSCPAPIELEQEGAGGIPASDPRMMQFLAGAAASDLCDPGPTVVNDAPASFDAGVTPVTFRATDHAGNASECTSAVTIVPASRSPDCSSAWASPSKLVRLDRQLHPIQILGVVDAHGNAATIHVTGVTQDEPLVERDADNDEGRHPDGDHRPWGHRPREHQASAIVGDEVAGDEHAAGPGDGLACPDAVIDAAGGVSLRSERLAHGNGRVYVVTFTATDAAGSECTGAVRVCVLREHDGRPGRHAGEAVAACVDDGQRFNSLGPCPPRRHDGTYSAASDSGVTLSSGASGGPNTLEYSLRVASDVQIALFDVTGRRVATLFEGFQSAGSHRLNWNAARLEQGIYFCRVRAGSIVQSKSVLVLK